MTTDDPPTLGEVMRRLDSITSQLVEIVKEIRSDRVDAAKTYVRQDVHQRAEQLINSNISDVRTDVAALDTKVESHHEQYKRDRAADVTTRRQTFMWLGTLTVTVLFGIGGLLLSLLTFLR